MPGPLTTDFVAAPSWGVLWAIPAVSSAYATEGSGEVVLHPSSVAGEWCGLYAQPSFALRARRVSVEVPQVTDEALMLFSADNGSAPWLRMHYLSGAMHAVFGSGDVSMVPYDPVKHRFWQIREQAGSVFFETSPDGAVYTTLYQGATPSFVDSVRWSVGAGTGNAIATPGVGLVRNAADCLL